MIVVDVEATGTEPGIHGLVSIGAIDLDKPERQFYEECHIDEGIHVMKEALRINGFSEQELYDISKPSEEEIVTAFISWALDTSDHTIAGQNPSFDRDFIRAGAKRYHIDWPLAYRTVDLHSVCVTHMLERKKELPIEKERSALTSDAIFSYVGLPAEPHPHNALVGAQMEAEAFSRLFWGKKLLPDFERYDMPTY
ncbi:MAG: 3'-5' exonuclease [Candidatus Paceibacterota bacterium]